MRLPVTYCLDAQTFYIIFKSSKPLQADLMHQAATYFSKRIDWLHNFQMLTSFKDAEITG